MAWVIKQILFSYSFDIFSRSKMDPSLHPKITKMQNQKFHFFSFICGILCMTLIQIFYFSVGDTKERIIGKSNENDQIQPIYYIRYLSCCREGFFRLFKYEELSREHFRANLTLRRPTCQSWHMKIFFSSHGSAWTAMSKQWKISSSFIVRILYKYY